MTSKMERAHPLLSLGDEDLDLVLKLTLASGSLKELAEQYGVSYPTIRIRLDRLLERLRAAVNARPVDPMADLLATMVEKGEITPRAARAVLEMYRKQLDSRKED
jgi:hypothetical protein